MFLHTGKKIDGKSVAIAVRYETRNRLAGTCFRGRFKPLAGNFIQFQDCLDVFRRDGVIVDELVNSAGETYREHDKTDSVCIECESLVGWSGTDHRGKYFAQEVEPYEPNRHSFVWRVRLDRRDLKAPLTKLVTVVYEVKVEADMIVIIVWSIYPGQDIGPLRGDVSGREGIVMFDWNHPGEPLPQGARLLVDV